MNWTAVHQIKVYKAIIDINENFYKVWGQLLSIGCEFGIKTVMSDSLECSLRSLVYVSPYPLFGWLFIVHVKCELLYKFIKWSITIRAPYRLCLCHHYSIWFAMIMWALCVKPPPVTEKRTTYCYQWTDKITVAEMTLDIVNIVNDASLFCLVV